MLESIFDRLFRRERFDRAMEEEFQFHIAEHAAHLQRMGLDAEEADRRARLDFGGIENHKEECRETRSFNGLQDLLRDLRFGMRILWSSPGFSALAILCLVLGIGANAVVYSWVEGILMRPYPAVVHQERLMVLAGTATGLSRYDEVSWPDFQELQRNCTLFDAFIAEKITGASLSVGDRADWAIGSLVSANYFDALGVHPILGRAFQAGEDTGRNAHPVVVISYRFWKEHFNGDRGIIGKTQLLNSLPFTIVGVAPEKFYGTFVGYAWQFWVPASMQERFDSTGYKLEDRNARWLEGFVRLKPGVTAAQAQQQISAVAARMERDYPATNRGRGIKLVPLWQSPFNNSSVMLPTLSITTAVVFFILLIACANVSNLLLVRSFIRRHEITIRLAVGAKPIRLLKQLLTEGLLLSALGAIGGLLLAFWSRNLLVLLIPPRGVPVYLAGQIDWRVVALSATVCLLSTVLFALFPALQSSRINIANALKCEAAGVIGGRGRSWLRSTLVLLQVSLSFVLLVGAGLLIQSWQQIRMANPGFETQKVLATALDLFGAGYDKGRGKYLQDQLIDRLQTMNGVESAAYARIIPFSYRTYNFANIAVDGYNPAPREQPSAQFDEVSPGYFATIGIPLLAGRDFRRADDESAPRVAIVNETMAAKYWGGSNPVGKRLQVDGKWMLIIGIAKNAKYENMLETARAFFYVPLRQNFYTQVGILIRTRQNPGAMSTALAAEFHALDPNLPLYEVTTMREHVDQQTSTQQTAAMLIGTFGALALLLATIGLYGVMSYSVSQSRRELGLRMALGAQPSHILRLVMSRGMILTASGILVGLVAAFICTRLLGYLLFNVSPYDPLSFGSALIVIASASLAACLLPALRASRTDPLRALGA